MTCEFKDCTVTDWMDNRKWFDVKLLVDVFGRKLDRRLDSSGNFGCISRKFDTFLLEGIKL